MMLLWSNNSSFLTRSYFFFYFPAGLFVIFSPGTEVFDKGETSDIDHTRLKKRFEECPRAKNQVQSTF